MAEYQKFVFSNDYSTEADALERMRQEKLTEAREMLQSDFETAKKQAFEEGFQEGQKMALEKLKTEMDLHINTIIENITKINEYKPELHNLFEQHSTACVRHITNNLFFKAQELYPVELLEQSVENALSNLPMVSKIIIRVPSNCKMYVEDTKIEEKVRQTGISDFAFVEDRDLKPGECSIEWDKSGVLSSKVDSFEKINSTLEAFVSPEDIELSDNTTSLAEKETSQQEELTPEINIKQAITSPESIEPLEAPVAN
ncbi:MAG TPA: hypothetical protein DCL21_06950 [Alphaproteobacteria bacterium]|nr:hypothetical protein [Alphaproteobacteria bacterium]